MMDYSNRDLGSMTAVFVAAVAPTMTVSLWDRVTEFIIRTSVFGSKKLVQGFSKRPYEIKKIQCVRIFF